VTPAHTYALVLMRDQWYTTQADIIDVTGYYGSSPAPPTDENVVLSVIEDGLLTHPGEYRVLRLREGRIEFVSAPMRVEAETVTVLKIAGK
jgi:hypothetical protein